MKIKKNYIVSVLVCTVLFLASCTDENLVDNPHAQNALRTVSVDLGMPQDKPAYADGTTSRAALDAQTAEILLGDSTLSVSRAEGSSEGTSSAWVNDDQILVKIDAGSTQARLTLQYIDPAATPAPVSGEEPQTATAGWYLMKEISYVKYTGTEFKAYNAQGVTPMIAGDTSDDADKLAIDFTQPLTLHLDWTASQPTVSIIYAPDMEWNYTTTSWGNYVTMEQKADASTATTAPELWTVAGNAWTTNQARLRVNTGGEGDVVTLTSSAFDSAWEDEPTGGVFTATTDDQGDAYFYGTTVDAQGNPSALTDGFLVQLTQMRVHVSGQGETAVYTTLNTNVTLLEASDVVPVTLAAETAYKLMADVKRTASAKTNLSVIDGQCGITEVTDGLYVGTDDHVAAVKAQIETAVAMGITEFTVINQLATYSAQGNMFAGTVVGEAIMQLVSVSVENNNMTFDTTDPEYGSISLVLRDATTVPNGAFQYCAALQSVTLNEVTQIGNNAFLVCSALESATLNEVTEIGNNAFLACVALENVTLDKVTSIGDNAFYFCSSLTSIESDAVLQVGMTAFSECTELTAVNLPNATQIYISAFLHCSKLTTVNMPNVTSLGSSAFKGTALTNLTLGKVTEVDADENEYSLTFSGVRTEDCDLTLHAEQQETEYPVTASNGKLMWADEEWKSIKVGDKVYTQETGYVSLTIGGTETYAVIDGTCGATLSDDGYYHGDIPMLANMKAQIQAILANAQGEKNIFVTKGLAIYSGPESIACTIVGAAIHTSGAADGSITLVLDSDITKIPSYAFHGCKQLGRVEARGVTNITQYAFSDCTNITVLKFEKVITSVDASAFANVSNCDLVLPAGQTGVTTENGNLMWAGAAWNSITIGGVPYVDNSPS